MCPPHSDQTPPSEDDNPCCLECSPGVVCGVWCVCALCVCVCGVCMCGVVWCVCVWCVCMCVDCGD